jgi:Protein of unknown function (DUF3105)
MSISTPQGGSSKSEPGTVRVTGKSANAGGKPGAGKATDGKPASGQRTGAPRPGGGGGNRPGGPRRPITPVVKPARNWTAWIVGAVVLVIAASIVGYAIYQVHEDGIGYQTKADAITGIKDYRKSDPKMLTYEAHATGVIPYPMHPPVGGAHNPVWQRCLGDVYDAPIADEHAVHSMEHGAVWIAYNPDLPAAQVAQLAAKVKGNDYMLMSPYPGLDTPISLQTWGFQLKLDSASDPRVDEFIKDLRQISSVEPGATCASGGITATGTTPHDLGGNTAPYAPTASAKPSSPAPTPSASKS